MVEYTTQLNKWGERMTMSNEEMLVAITELFNSKFSDMETNIQKLDNKIDETKLDLIDRMDIMKNNILNSCLGHTNDHYESIMEKLDNLQSTVNTLARIDELDERVERLEKIS